MNFYYSRVFSSDNIKCNSTSPSINPTDSTNNLISNISLFNNHNLNFTYFYFLPYDFIESYDNSSLAIINLFTYATSIVYMLNGNIPYGKFHFNTTFLNTSFESTRINMQKLPIINKTDNEVNSRDATIRITLNDNGYIWAVIEMINNIDKNLVNVINTPDKSNFSTLAQLLNGFNRTNITAIGSDFKFFNNDTGAPANLTFVNLEPGTNYGIFYVASNEGLDNFRTFTPISWFSISTPFEGAERIMIGLVLAIVLMIYCLI